VFCGFVSGVENVGSGGVGGGGGKNRGGGGGGGCADC